MGLQFPVKSESLRFEQPTAKQRTKESENGRTNRPKRQTKITNNQRKQAINQQTKQINQQTNRNKNKFYGTLMVAQIVKKSPAVTESTSSLPCSKQPATSLKFEPRKANTTPPKYLLKIHFNITLKSMRRSYKWHLPLQVFIQLFLSILSSNVLHALPISCSYV